jgi:putative molybdopterin biosynthesis protein
MSETRRSTDQARSDLTTAGVQLHYTFGPGTQRGASLDNPLFTLLDAVRQAGSIHHAAQLLGCSYRFLWGALHNWEVVMGEPLIVWVKGQRARLTEFAERLLWAERRARVRMQPHIEALRADLMHVLAEARDERLQLLTVVASHDLALPLLQVYATESAALHLDIRFQGSVESLRALNEGHCLVAGFHVPTDLRSAGIFSSALKPLLQPGEHKLIGCHRRRQGLMMRGEYAGTVRSFTDLADSSLRFVNRQIGSGTRLLVDHLMHEARLEPQDIRGYAEEPEHSHVAVAAYVASGLADVGAGVEAAAAEFGLHFVPLADEDYYLACLKRNLEHPAVQRLCSVLATAGWSKRLAPLPGYAPTANSGGILKMTAVLPWWRYTRPKVPGTRRRGHQAPLVK